MSIPSTTNNRVESSVKGEGKKSGQERGASVGDSESELVNGKSLSEDTKSDVEMPEAVAADPITSGRASISGARGSEYGVLFVAEGVTPSGERIVTASWSGDPSGVPGERYAVLHAGEVRRLTQYLPEPLRSAIRGRTWKKTEIKG